MAFTRIHHVGMVTSDLESARHVLCEGFGLSVDGSRTPGPQGRPGAHDRVTTLEFPIGEMYYEVSKPTDADSRAAAFLTSTNGRGGIQYLSVASNDISADVKALMDRGVKLQGDWNGEGPVFLDPTTSLGISLQIIPDDGYYVHPYYRGNGTLTGMAHLGIAARSTEEVRQFWGQVFGLEEDKSMERGLTQPQDRPPRPADDPVHLVEFPLGGSVIEISIPTTTESGTAKLVASRATLGAVYHHTCPFAPDVHRMTEQAVAAGLQQIGTIPPREEAEGNVVAWFHPRTCLGMLVEIWNRTPGESHYRGPLPG